MSKEIRHHFTVEGSGPFPIDMLRYDHCWPETEQSSSGQIYDSFISRRKNFPRYKIALVGVMPPTRARWESFGWKLIDERKVTLV